MKKNEVRCPKCNKLLAIIKEEQVSLSTGFDEGIQIKCNRCKKKTVIRSDRAVSSFDSTVDKSR